MSEFLAKLKAEQQNKVLHNKMKLEVGLGFGFGFGFGFGLGSGLLS